MSFIPPPKKKYILFQKPVYAMGSSKNQKVSFFFNLHNFIHFYMNFLAPLRTSITLML